MPRGRRGNRSAKPVKAQEQQPPPSLVQQQPEQAQLPLPTEQEQSLPSTAGAPSQQPLPGQLPQTEQLQPQPMSSTAGAPSQQPLPGQQPQTEQLQPQPMQQRTVAARAASASIDPPQDVESGEDDTDESDDVECSGGGASRRPLPRWILRRIQQRKLKQLKEYLKSAAFLAFLCGILAKHSPDPLPGDTRAGIAAVQNKLNQALKKANFGKPIPQGSTDRGTALPDR